MYYNPAGQPHCSCSPTLGSRLGAAAAPARTSLAASLSDASTSAHSCSLLLQAAGSGSESDDEGMSDEAMFRMDAKLAAYFAAAQQSRRGAKAAREELANFKMRVAALLEAFIKKVGGVVRKQGL